MSFGKEESILNQLNIKVKNDLDTILITKNGKFIYTFKDSTCRKFSIQFYQRGCNIEIISGYPKQINSEFIGIPSDFSTCGYVNFNNTEILMFTKDRQYWLFDENSGKVFNGFPRNLNNFHLWKNKSEFDKIRSLDAIFIWNDAGRKSYNCFVSSNMIYMININNPNEIIVKNLSYVFQNLPNFINSACNIHTKPYLIFLSDYTWYIYNESKGQLYENNNDLNSEYKPDESQNTEKMQEWCNQLYKQKIYNKDEYNQCITDIAMLGTSIGIQNNIITKDIDEGGLQHELSLYNREIIGKTQSHFKDNEPVYIVSGTGHYLKSDKDGIVSLNKTLEEPMNEFEWTIQRLSKDVYTFKNNFGHFLEADESGNSTAPNTFVGPLSKWNLIQYGTAYDLYHHDTQKSLKANPLGLDYYNPNDNMMWNIIPLEQESTIKMADVSEVENQKRYLIENYKQKIKQYILSLEAKNFEDEYRLAIENKMEEFKHYLEQYTIKTARKYNSLPPKDEKRYRDDIQYKKWYDTNEWKNNLGPNSNRVRKVEYREKTTDKLESINNVEPFINFNFIDSASKSITGASEYVPKIAYVDGRDLYNDGKSKVDVKFQDLRNAINKAKLNYASARINKQKPTIERLNESKQHFNQSVKEINDWKTDMLDKIAKEEAEREKIKKQIQYQLSTIDKLEKREKNLDNQKSDYESINVNNLQIIKEKNKLIMSRIYSYYGIILLSSMWMLFMIYKMF